MPAATPPKIVPAVQRASRILGALAAASEPQGVNALARGVGMVPSTCLHILRTLVAEGMVSVDVASKRYRLGSGVLTLARSMLASNDLAVHAAPLLRDLSRSHNLTAIATELDNRDHVVALAHGRTQMSIHVDVGSRFPAYISASGRCFAAHQDLSEQELRTAYAGLRWQRAPGFDTWLAEVRAARRDGCAIDRDGYIRGVTILAAPILSQDGRAWGGLAAVGLSEQLDAAVTGRLERDLKAAVAQLRQTLR
jgi:DNA-binding IclR family transcriptional regulator